MVKSVLRFGSVREKYTVNVIYLQMQVLLVPKAHVVVIVAEMKEGVQAIDQEVKEGVQVTDHVVIENLLVIEEEPEIENQRIN
jgi:dihydroorotase-like cyclic amidohydrolase